MAKILTEKDIDLIRAAEAKVSKDLRKAPSNRSHACVKLNGGGFIVAWVNIRGSSALLVTTDYYGSGSLIAIAFCPFCGEKLA